MRINRRTPKATVASVRKELKAFRAQILSFYSKPVRFITAEEACELQNTARFLGSHHYPAYCIPVTGEMGLDHDARYRTETRRGDR